MLGYWLKAVWFLCLVACLKVAAFTRPPLSPHTPREGWSEIQQEIHLVEGWRYERMRHSTTSTRCSGQRLRMANFENDKLDDEIDASSANNKITDRIQAELEQLQNQLSLIEALESRNEAQLDSFVDKQDQWESMEEEDRQLLKSKENVVDRMETLTEELVQLWMGAKSLDG